MIKMVTSIVGNIVFIVCVALVFIGINVLIVLKKRRDSTMINNKLKIVDGKLVRQTAEPDIPITPQTENELANQRLVNNPGDIQQPTGDGFPQQMGPPQEHQAPPQQPMPPQSQQFVEQPMPPQQQTPTMAPGMMQEAPQQIHPQYAQQALPNVTVTIHLKTGQSFPVSVPGNAIEAYITSLIDKIESGGVLQLDGGVGINAENIILYMVQ